MRNDRAAAELEAEAQAGFEQAVELAVKRLRGGAPSASTVESLLSAELRQRGLESEDTARVAEQLAAALALRAQAAERQPEVAR